MRFLLNNRNEETEEKELTVSSLLEKKKFTFRMRMIKVNGVLVPRERYNTTIIREGDNVHILYLTSGG